jgi:hypothetical protein
LQIAGHLWNLSGQGPLSDQFSFASPVCLKAVKDVWIPPPGDQVYFTARRRPGSFRSRIAFQNAIDESPREFSCDLVDGHIAAVASNGQYILTASFVRGDNNTGDTSMTKHLRLTVYRGGSIDILRTIFFKGHWSIVNKRNRFIDGSRGVKATFHPNLPIMAWRFSWFNLGFWLIDLRENSPPVFIEGNHPTRSRKHSN